MTKWEESVNITKEQWMKIVRIVIMAVFEIAAVFGFDLGKQGA